MHTKRPRSIVVLLALVLTGALLTLWLWNASPQTAGEYFASGQEYYESGDYAEAGIQFLNAIREDPGSRDARYLLSQTYLRRGNPNEAARQLLALLEYFPEDSEAGVQLGNIYLSGGRSDPHLFDEARKLAQGVLAVDAENVPALILMGNALAGLEDYRSSADSLDRALTLDPQNAAALISLGTTEVLRQNYPEAEQAFLGARDADPSNTNALMALAHYYRASGDPARAEPIFREAFRVDPSDQAIYTEVATFLFAEGQLEDAEEVLRDAQGRNRQDPTPALILASMYRADNQIVRARALLTDLGNQMPDNLAVAVNLAQLLIETDRTAAWEEVTRIVDGFGDEPIGPVLLGELQLLSGDFDAAAATLGQDLVINSTIPAAHYLLGQVAEARGDDAGAQRSYQKTLELNANFAQARVALASLLVRDDRVREARAEVDRALIISPGSLDALLLDATITAAEGDDDAAERKLVDLLDRQPDNPLIHLRLGLHYQRRGMNDQAERNLLRAVELAPASPEVLQTASQFYASRGQIDAALELIDEHVPESSRQAFHYDLIGQVYSSGERAADAEGAFRKALDLEPDRTDTLEHLVDELIRDGRLEEALGPLNDLVRYAPSSAKGHEVLGMVLQTLGHSTEAKESYERTLELDPSSFVAANNLANILSEEGNSVEALGRAQTARRLSPDNPAAADTLGWIQHQIGSNQLAREQLEFAVSRQPENPVFQYHLGMVYRETNQPGQAAAALRSALASQRDFEERNLAQAALEEVLGN